MTEYKPLQYTCPAGQHRSIYVHQSLIERVEPDTKNPICSTVYLHPDKLQGAEIPLVYYMCNKHDAMPAGQSQAK